MWAARRRWLGARPNASPFLALRGLFKGSLPSRRVGRTSSKPSSSTSSSSSLRASGSSLKCHGTSSARLVSSLPTLAEALTRSENWTLPCPGWPRGGSNSGVSGNTKTAR